MKKNIIYIILTLILILPFKINAKLMPVCKPDTSGNITVSFVTNNDTSVSSMTRCGNCSNVPKTPFPTPSSGYDYFVGWYTDSQTLSKYAGTTLADLRPIPAYDEYGCQKGWKDIVLYGKWTYNNRLLYCNHISYYPFDIFFSTNDDYDFYQDFGCYNDCSRSGYHDLPSPTKTGYTFDGWYYDSAYKNKVQGKTNKDVKYLADYDYRGCIVGFLGRILYGRWIQNAAPVCTDIVGGNFEITFATFGGNKIPNMTQCVSCNTSKDLPIPVKTGYNFGGWYYDSLCTKKVSGSKTTDVEYTTIYDSNDCKVGYDTTFLYAKWNKNIDPTPTPTPTPTCTQQNGGSFKVNFYTNGGNAISQMTRCVGCTEDKMGKLPTPTRSGYTFLGWYLDSNFKTKISGSSLSSIPEQAIYDSKGCKTGYKDVTLYAQWIKNPVITCPTDNQFNYSIIFNTNGGNSIDSISNTTNLPDSKKKEVKLPTPKKDGFEFMGWYYDEYFNKKVESSNNLGVNTTAIYDNNGCISGMNNVTLYALWKKIEVPHKECETPPDSFSLIFNSNGGTSFKNLSVCVTCNYNFNLPAPTKSGYTFSGWYFDSSFNSSVVGSSTSSVKNAGNPKYDDSGCLVSYNPVTLYAKWNKNQVVCAQFISNTITLKYDTVDGSKIDNDLLCIGCNKTEYKDIPTPTKEGYTFSGWYYDSSYKKPITGGTTMDISTRAKVKYDSGGCPVGYKDITIYARWKSNKVECKETKPEKLNVIFNTNGGSEIEKQAICITCNEKETKELAKPTKKGSVFVGWYYDEFFTTKVTSNNISELYGKETLKYDKDGCVESYNDITLYAKWDNQESGSNLGLMTIFGNIEDISGVSLSGKFVYLDDINNKSEIDYKGNFEFNDVAPGAHSLVVVDFMDNVVASTDMILALESEENLENGIIKLSSNSSGEKLTLLVNDDKINIKSARPKLTSLFGIPIYVFYGAGGLLVIIIIALIFKKDTRYNFN